MLDFIGTKWIWIHDEHPLTPSTRVIAPSGSAHESFPTVYADPRGASSSDRARPRFSGTSACQAEAEELGATVWFTRRSPAQEVRRNLALVMIDTTRYLVTRRDGPGTWLRSGSPDAACVAESHDRDQAASVLPAGQRAG